MATLQDTFMQQLRETFAAEAKEHLHAISNGLLALENGPGETGMDVVLAEMFRAAHSLKGAARAVGLEEVATLAHHLESILGLVRSGALPTARTPFDVLYATVDALAILTEPGGGDHAGLQLDALAAKLAAAAVTGPAAVPVAVP
ncbi:MAG: Hpt domain-containing protein, partial [Caldilinea sp.]|nr:Hpt domain-containing protein [Caldilinea sp.]